MKHSIVLLALVGLAGTAHADNKEKADALFKQGKKLMGEKRYAEACESFEKSYKLDPGIGAQLNIAKCYEEWGKIGRAFVAYQAAEKEAHDAKDPREPKIHELVVAVEPNVPHLTIKVPKDAPPDFKVTLDGKPVTTFNDAMVVDPGPKLIEWSVKGSAKKNKVVAIDRGGESEVTLDVPKVETKPGPIEKPVGPEKPDGGDKPAADPGRMWKIGGMALGGAGVVAIGISSYLTLSARSRYKDALDMYCGGMTNSCDMQGLEITHDARHTANIATIVFFAGVAMAGGGAALYFLAPKAHEGAPPAEAEQTGFYITPAISPDGAGIVVGGRL